MNKTLFLSFSMTDMDTRSRYKMDARNHAALFGSEYGTFLLPVVHMAVSQSSRRKT